MIHFRAACTWLNPFVHGVVLRRRRVVCTLWTTSLSLNADLDAVLTKRIRLLVHTGVRQLLSFNNFLAPTRKHIALVWLDLFVLRIVVSRRWVVIKGLELALALHLDLLAVVAEWFHNVVVAARDVAGL